MGSDGLTGHVDVVVGTCDSADLGIWRVEYIDSGFLLEDEFPFLDRLSIDRSIHKMSKFVLLGGGEVIVVGVILK